MLGKEGLPGIPGEKEEAEGACDQSTAPTQGVQGAQEWGRGPRTRVEGRGGRRGTQTPCSREPEARWWHWAGRGDPLLPLNPGVVGETGDSGGGQGPAPAWAAPSLSFPTYNIKERVELGASEQRCPQPHVVAPNPPHLALAHTAPSTRCLGGRGRSRGWSHLCSLTSTLPTCCR